MMRWATEHLLKCEINKLSAKDNLDKDEQFILLQCQKELEVLKRLKIEGIDMRGTIEEVETRLKGNSIYFLDKTEYDSMHQKSVLFDAVKNVVNS